MSTHSEIITQVEHDGTAETKGKRVFAYGWDSNALAPIRLTADSSGRLQTSSINPLNNYVLAEDDSSGTTKYWGYVDVDGNWFIMRETTSNEIVSYRFTKGVSDFATNWASRTTESYDYLYNTF